MGYRRKTWREKLSEDKGLPRIITINQIRAKLARRHGATIGCPICTGIFASVAARAAGEDAAAGKSRVTPYWRTLKKAGVINEKYPGGVPGQKRLLEKEGHRVVRKGKRWVVQDFRRALVRT